MTSDVQRQLVQQLQSPAAFQHPVSTLHCIETHISWVLLTGEYAYKIKKAVDFGFLDFSTLEKRRFFCAEELRLNGRFSENLYLDVVAIRGNVDRPQIDLAGIADAVVIGQHQTQGDAQAPAPVLEYAVKMRQFPQEQLIESCIKRGEITIADIESIALTLAEFHSNKAARLPEDNTTLGTFAAVAQPALDNFSQIESLQNHFGADTLLKQLREWTKTKLDALKPLIEERRESGFVVECHGDLHLGNIAVLDGKITFFDGIEFSERLRWIDTQSELAYLIMDLEDKGYAEWANHLLNVYLEETGDYLGLALLPLYKVYRALVRAKVNALRAHQADISAAQSEQCRQAFLHYLTLAESFTRRRSVFLAITHGVSGSGKTYLTTPLVEQSGAIRLRSDVERKRLFNLSRLASSDSGIDTGIYTASASDATYQRLLELSEALLSQGYAVIVDATFLKRARRQSFAALAKRHNALFRILHCEAAAEVLRQRLLQRQQLAKDASEAGPEVLEHQQQGYEVLDETERAETTNLSADTDLNRLSALLRHAQSDP